MLIKSYNFYLEVAVEKENWRWDKETKTIINPLLKEIGDLEAMGEDYDFLGGGKYCRRTILLE